MTVTKELKSGTRKALDWSRKYLRTWQQLIVQPFSFVGLSDKTRREYVGPWGFATATFLIGGAASYLIATIADDPLFPPGIISFSPPLLLYVQLVLFVVAWMLLAVVIRKALLRIATPVPFRRLLEALVYLLVGTVSFYGLFWFGLLWLGVSRLKSASVGQYLLEHQDLLAGGLIALFILLVAPSFVVAWFVSKTVRQFYRVGALLGVFFPACAWLLLQGLVYFVFLCTTLDRLTPSEREALRRVHIIADVEAMHRVQEGAWQADLQALTEFQLTDHELSQIPFLVSEVAKSRSYTEAMEGYRFSILVYNDGRDCLVRAVPVEYGRATKLSFAVLCPHHPVIGGLPPLAEDARGGQATFAGRKIIAYPGWYLPQSVP